MIVGVVEGTVEAVTLCITKFDVLCEKFASPPYTAVMGCSPTASDDVMKVAIPLLLNALTPFVMGVPLSRNVTLPEGVPPPAAPFTTAVNVTICPADDGDSEDAMAIAEGLMVRLVQLTVAMFVEEIEPTTPLTVSAPAAVPV